MHKHYTYYLSIVGIKYVYIYIVSSMHMKLSLLSSDMDTASNTSIYICARYTSMNACYILGIELCN